MAVENHVEVSVKDLATSVSPTQYLAVKRELAQHLKKDLVKGDTWYLIDSHWNKQLAKYLKSSSAANEADDDAQGVEMDANAHPGRIDNSSLYKADPGEPGEIREHMMEELDYVVVPEEAWQLLVRHFGLTEGQKPIARRVVEHGTFVKHCKVEVYKHEFLLADGFDVEKPVKKKFSKSDTMSAIIQEMRELFEIEEDVEVRLWMKYSGGGVFEQIMDLSATVQGHGLFAGQLIVIQKQNPDGTWSQADNANSALSNQSTAVSDGRKADDSEDESSTKPSTSVPKGSIVSKRPTTFNSMGVYGEAVGGSAGKAQPGLCGLSNLGNTCFMNSIIQGLSNTPPMMEYFAYDNYIEDINEENPLGMKGEIARTFGEVVKSMWSGKYSSIVPRNFKTAVGRFAPQFSGYQQQDSQELLTFLLDGLHEDLNRVKKKPYIEIKDSGGRPDEEVAAEAWEVYKKRNDSVILDLFHGLLKSTVVCPECPKISVTFDPFCCLSLPLPVRKERQIEVVFVFMDQAKCPTKYKVTCPKEGCMRNLCEALSKLCDVADDKMVVTDVYNHRFHKIYAENEGLNQILERDDIFVYEVPSTEPDHPDMLVTPLYFREKKSSMSYSPSNLFGRPLLLGLPKKVTYEALYEKLVTSLSRYVTPPKEGVVWWKSNKLGNNADGGAVNGVNGNNNASSDNDDKDANDESMVEDEDEEEDDGKGPPKLFAMALINSYGNAQVDELRNDGEPLNITARQYLSLDWHPTAKKMFYNEQTAEEEAQDESLRVRASVKKQVVSLSECLELYTTKEKLGELNTWRCPSCKKDQQATKKFDLWSLPSVLVVSLKRFSFNRYWRDKLDTEVDFPIRGLDMSPYIINNNHGSAVYDLIAVSNHYGGMGGGHYTAFAKNKDDGKWYYFDDSNVTPSSEDGVVTKAAYVLFYQRRDGNRTNSYAHLTNGKLHIKDSEASSEEDMDTN